MFYCIGLIDAEGIVFHHYKLRRTSSHEGYCKTFLHNNWFDAAVFASVLGDYWLR